MMGFMLYLYGFPVLSLALVAWALASRRLSGRRRPAFMAATILTACATLTLIRTNGLTGDADSDLEWRWTQTAEERLLARPAALASAPAAPAQPEPPSIETTEERSAPTEALPVAAARPDPATDIRRPGFRGPDRNSVIRGVRIETDWSHSPPVELWRRPIGPGWSSLAVGGDLIYTQEQRGDEEVVSAYSIKTGEPVWTHRDAARFWESNAGPGPRATPTLSRDRVYALGGTGILNALDARDGSLAWSRNVATDTRTNVPDGALPPRRSSSMAS